MDSSLTHSLNQWAAHFQGVLPFFSDWMVYIVFLTATAWVLMHHLGRIRQMFIDFIFTLALPIGTAVVISEGLSKLIDRARPFVADKSIRLLVPHGADGGFPSHHTTVMIAIAVAIWYRNHNLGFILFGLGLISGLARIAAGIHYPTDIFAGVVIGWITAWAVHNLSKDFRLRLLRR